MIHPTSTNYEMAVRDFQRARKSAALRQILARLKGQSSDLLDYESICQQLKLVDKPVERGLEEIPLEKVVGSVGRYRDFTREFLPKHLSDESRWAAIKAAVTDMSGLPPIRVYQLGDAYFVLDGNHRVSVARQLGSQSISAHVTEVKTRVPFSAKDDPDEVICKARYANFLTKSNLDQARPEAALLMTLCGHYQTLIDQIECKYQLMVQEAGSGNAQISWEQAAASWYDSVYLPVINIMRELGVMRRFPNRTETDIYVLLSERREELEWALGWNLNLEETLPTLVLEDAQGLKEAKPVGYLSKMMDSIRPEMLEGVQVGAWRSRQLAMHRTERLFADMLVLFEGIDEDWLLLEAALKMAASDHDRVLAIHVVNTPAQKESPAVLAMIERFQQRCKEMGLVGEFAVEAGSPIPIILKRAAWSDLLFVNLTHPPKSNILARIQSFWGPLIMRCPRPLLITPHAKFTGTSPMLLAYDGSPKADEALFVATYNASRWKNELTVLTVQSAVTKPDALARARDYLEKHGVQHARYEMGEGNIGQAIIETAATQGSNLIVMGGFGASPVMRLLRGSSVEYVLQHTSQSIMICQ